MLEEAQKTHPVLSVVLAVLFAAFVLALCIGQPPGLGVPLFLAIGWVLFLIRTLPQVHFRWDIALSTIVCAVVLIAGAHAFLRWLYREMAATPAAPRWRFRWTLAGFTLVILMFASGVAALGIVHQVNWLARSPQPLFESSGRERANRVKCASNLRQIGYALELCARENNGRYPDDFSALIRDADLNAEIFVCPSGPDEKAVGTNVEEIIRKFLAEKQHCSYLYLASGTTKTASPDRVIVIEPVGNHVDGVNVLFADGRVEWLARPDARDLIESLGIISYRTGQPTPATRPTTRPTTSSAIRKGKP